MQNQEGRLTRLTQEIKNLLFQTDSITLKLNKIDERDQTALDRLADMEKQILNKIQIGNADNIIFQPAYDQLQF